MQSQRNYALDLLRGLTIALMIIVNNPGDWQQMFSILRHAEWHGFLGADIVFPLFLFVAGYAAALKITRDFSNGASGPHCASALTLEEPEPPHFYRRLVRRAVVLFIIGVFLNAWPFGLLPGTDFSIEKIRVFGVLQRIAICVLIGGIILRHLRTTRGIMVAICALALIYEILMRLPLISTVEGNFGRSFELTDNFARLVDLTLIPQSMLYKVQKITFDPEGLLTSTGAVMTFLFGALCYRMPLQRFTLVCILMVLGGLWAIFEPVNKNLWTMPYVLLTAGFGCALLTFFEKIRFSEMRIAHFLSAPFADMGRNSLLIYTLSGIVGKALAFGKTTSGVSYKVVLYKGLQFLPLSGKLSSLAYSLIFLALLAVLARLLRRIPLSV